VVEWWSGGVVEWWSGGVGRSLGLLDGAALIPRTVENGSEGGGLFSKQSIRPGASCWDVGWTWRQPVRP
jgi:hypothetical protein